MNEHKKFDFVIYGATGFTGKLVVEYAIITLICDWNTAMNEPNIDVKQPIEQIIIEWIIN